MKTRYPHGMTEFEVRAGLAVRRRKLEDRSAELKRTLRQAAKELEQVEGELGEVDMSVDALNAGTL